MGLLGISLTPLFVILELNVNLTPQVNIYVSDLSDS